MKCQNTQRIIKLKKLLNQQEIYEGYQKIRFLNYLIGNVEKDKADIVNKIDEWVNSNLVLERETVGIIVSQLINKYECAVEEATEKEQQKENIEITLKRLNSTQEALNNRLQDLKICQDKSLVNDQFGRDFEENLSRYIYAKSNRNSRDIYDFSKNIKNENVSKKDDTVFSSLLKKLMKVSLKEVDIIIMIYMKISYLKSCF